MIFQRFYPMDWSCFLYFTGLGLGIFLFAKIVEHLLVNHERQMYCVIIGLVFSSPVVILWMWPGAGSNSISCLAGFPVPAGIRGGGSVRRRRMSGG